VVSETFGIVAGGLAIPAAIATALAARAVLADVLRAPRHRDQSFRRIVITCSTPS
jgi:hypothetical protein